MCGIAGILDPRSIVDLRQTASGMAARLAHRGPDDSGVWIDERSRIALAHRRLSIIDLSEAGHQPMESSDSRYVITYNGELYNYKDLQSQINADDPSVRWRSTCDTEVLLEAIRLWGVPGALRRSNGMFAFAVWDRARRVLTLARDRLGEKPLYYGVQQRCFVFTSEIKALTGLAGWRPRVSSEGMELFFRFGCVPAPVSIVEGLLKLTAGCYVEIAANDVVSEALPDPKPYWDLFDIASRPHEAVSRLSDREFVDVLERRLDAAVRRQLVSDAPIGALLSGGIDSSMIVSLMQRNSASRIQTYTVSFYEDEFSEGAYARRVAHHLGTDHTEVFVTAQDALDVIPKLPHIYDEPFSDTSQIPTYLVAQLASRYVKVCLSGDGGDELFGGYNRHVWGPKLQRTLELLPRFARGTIASAAENVRRRLAERRLAERSSLGAIATGRLQKLTDAISCADSHGIYMSFASHWKPSETPLAKSGAPNARPAAWRDLGDLAATMRYCDAMWYLPDDVLVKLDRAAMAASLETRAPMLDKDVVELAFSLPARRHIGAFAGKKLLRTLLYRHVPKKLVDRPKAGFQLPISEWMRGPLRDWIESLLSRHSIEEHGLLSFDSVRRKWEEHLNGQRDWHAQIWDVVAFQGWWSVYCHGEKSLPTSTPSEVRIAGMSS